MFGNWEQERAISLAELALMIEGVIAEAFNRGYWVKAEMAKLNLYPESGHCYPDLVEKEGRTVKAQMRGTIWAGNYQRISRKFLDITREPLKDGLQILCFATVKFHPQYGLSLQISDIDPTFTLGQMARERLETIRRLKEEGVFGQNKQLPFPLLPKRIAIISVSTSKGYSDFIKILESYSDKYRFRVSLFPALLQGDKAVDSITRQLNAIRKYSDLFDVVAIIRGGGGDVGLSCYDDYRMAREVAAFPLPVLTGIGHSTNETVVEMVAAGNKITPTDVAYSIVRQFENFSARLDEISGIIFTFAANLLSENDEIIHDLADRLQEETVSQLDLQRRRIDSMMRDTLQKSRLLLGSQNEKIASAGAVLRISPKRSVTREKDLLGNRMKWLSSTLTSYLEKERARQNLTENRIRLLDPVNTLKRGYSITYHKGKPLREAAGVSSGNAIATRLFRGEIISIVQSKKNEDGEENDLH